MTQAQHTPGPWKSEKDPNTNGSFNIFGSFNDKGDGIRLAIITSGPAEVAHPRWGTPHYVGCQGEANARLIAAAPELLEACEFVIEYWRSLKNEDGQSPDFSMVEAAIAKARPQSPAMTAALDAVERMGCRAVKS